MKIVTLVLLSVLAFATTSYARANDVFQQVNEPKQPAPKAASTRSISKEVAAQLAQDRFPGRVLRVRADARQYRVRVMQEDGRVVNVIVDGRNGRVRREE